MRRKVAAARPGKEVAFPMPGHGAIFDRRRPFADRYRVLHLAKPVPFQAGVPRAADRALRPEMLEKLLLQDTTRLNEQAFLDRLVLTPLLLFVRKDALEDRKCVVSGTSVYVR